MKKKETSTQRYRNEYFSQETIDQANVGINELEKMVKIYENDQSEENKTCLLTCASMFAQNTKNKNTYKALANLTNVYIDLACCMGCRGQMAYWWKHYDFVQFCIIQETKKIIKNKGE